MTTEFLNLRRIDPTPLSLLEVQRGTASIGTLMNQGLFAIAGHCCQLQQKPLSVLRFVWEPTAQTNSGMTTGAGFLLK